MLVVDLNDYSENFGPTKIARKLLKQEKYDPETIVRFVRGKTKVFAKDQPLRRWARTKLVENATQSVHVREYEAPVFAD